MFCHKCGCEIKNDDKFCQNCGSKIVIRKRNDNYVSNVKKTICYIILIVYILFALINISIIWEYMHNIIYMKIGIINDTFPEGRSDEIDYYISLVKKHIMLLICTGLPAYYCFEVIKPIIVRKIKRLKNFIKNICS